ncbi:WXG100 family type VII secretion target [Nocardia sp. CA-128927]|uniref:WXG100 family type VII secretion target n=1 Tax=Nocardia sp. CA-128927 TaxID=3239975 RepID=UPI003D97DD55
MGTVGVEPEQLRATADWLDQSAHEFADEVDQHLRKVLGFIGGDWQGTAAKSHQDPWDEWVDGARRIIGSFVTDAGLLRDAAGTYWRG